MQFQLTTIQDEDNVVFYLVLDGKVTHVAFNDCIADSDTLEEIVLVAIQSLFNQHKG